MNFCQYFKPISISLSPNTEKDDLFSAFKLLFQPWKWKKGKAIQEIENELKKYLGIKYAISFNSGRSALMAILNSLGLGKDDEVLLQAFTCNAAANPIIWSGLRPIYVDVDEKTFNIDPEDLKKKVTNKSRAVMVQHTFGLPSDMDETLAICQKNNLILIEDCAHSLGAEYRNRKVGTFGQAAFFSFSRDKVISSVYGGMAITNNDELAEKIKEYQERAGYPSYFWIKQQLLHPILMNWLILPTYSILGKYFLILFQWLQILSKAVHWKEKRGLRPGYFPKKMPNALSILALNQFKKLERFNNHRKEIAEFYRQELKNTSFELPQEKEQIYLRFTAKYPKANEIIKKAWQKNLLIGDWYTTPIAPHDTKTEKLHYKLGSCPKAEKLSKEVLNLPTQINISQKEAGKIIDFLKLCDESKDSSFTHRYRLGMEVKEIQDKKIWENFLKEIKEKTFLQSWNWGNFSKMMGNKIWRLGIMEHSASGLDYLVGVVSVVKVKAKRGIFLLIQHGPNIRFQISDSEASAEVEKKESSSTFRFKILETLLEKLREIAKEEEASFIRMNPLWERNQENQDILKSLGFKESPMHANAYEATLKLDLSLPEEELLGKMRKTTRYLIYQAQKNHDLEILKSDKTEDVELYHKLNQQVARYQQFVPFSFEFVKNEFNVLTEDNQVLLFFGKHQGKIIASALVVFWSGIGFYHQAALSPKYHKIPIAYLLQWEAIKEAKNRGCILYDFWGYVDPKLEPRHPWAGPTLFKMGFGGQPYEYVKTQDFPLSKKYWLTFIFEKIRKIKRGL